MRIGRRTGVRKRSGHTSRLRPSQSLLGIHQADAPLHDPVHRVHDVEPGPAYRCHVSIGESTRLTRQANLHVHRVLSDHLADPRQLVVQVRVPVLDAVVLGPPTARNNHAYTQ
jgi:hypothetical protein